MANTVYSTREIVQMVRDGLSLLEQQQSTGTAKQTIMQKLEKDAIETMRTILYIVDDMPRQERIWKTNGVDLMIESGKGMEEASFNVERFIEISTLFNSFKKWLYEPLDVKGLMITPIVILSRESNPLPKWGVSEEIPAQLEEFSEGVAP